MIICLSVAPMLLTQLLHVLHRFTVKLEGVGKVLGTDGDWTVHELRDVIASEELTVIIGVGTRQLKGLAGLAVPVDMGKEGSCVVAIIAATAEDHPSAVRRPGMVALRTLAVHLLQRMCGG